MLGGEEGNYYGTLNMTKHERGRVRGKNG